MGTLPVGAASHIVRQVASALSATHAKGIVHRDLKPANVFLLSVEGETDFVKVVDFGISKVRSATTKLTAALAVMGTPNYMAPEQAAGRINDIDSRTDQWALACIAYELLAGRPPFIGEDVASLLYQVIHQAPSPLAEFNPGLPNGVEGVLRRALAKTQAERFPDADGIFARVRGRCVGEGGDSGGRDAAGGDGGDGGRGVTGRRRDRAGGHDAVQPRCRAGDDVLRGGGRAGSIRARRVRVRPMRRWVIAGVGVAAALGVGAFVMVRPPRARDAVRRRDVAARVRDERRPRPVAARARAPAGRERGGAGVARCRGRARGGRASPRRREEEPPRAARRRRGRRAVGHVGSRDGARPRARGRSRLAAAGRRRAETGLAAASEELAAARLAAAARTPGPPGRGQNAVPPPPEKRKPGFFRRVFK